MRYHISPASLALMALFGLATASEDLAIPFFGMLRHRAPAFANTNPAAVGVSNAAAAPAAAAGTNMQTFTQALGGAAADPITQTGDTTKPFAVAGDTFNDFMTAATRSCNNQHNACAAIANGPQGKAGSGGKIASGLSVGDCDTQQTACIAQQSNVVVATSQAVTVSAQAQATQAGVSVPPTTTASANQTVKSADAGFFYICDVDVE